MLARPRGCFGIARTFHSCSGLLRTELEAESKAGAVDSLRAIETQELVVGRKVVVKSRHFRKIEPIRYIICLSCFTISSFNISA